MSRNYYVYAYWRLDNNDIFYIGKGINHRWKILAGRNDHFTNIINKVPIAVEILKDNLTEEEAFCWEEEIINILVFEYGYSIDLPNNRSNIELYNLTNRTWGGEGVIGNEHADFNGKNNPMYGKSHSENTRNKMSSSGSKYWENEENKKARLYGSNNPASTPCICLTTKRLFLTLKSAEEYYGCKNVGDCCCGRQHTAGKLLDGRYLIWKYINYKHNKTYRLKVNIRKIKPKEYIFKYKSKYTPPRKIICINNDKIYNNYTECSKDLKLNKGKISKCCKGEEDFILKDGVEYKFKFYE